ncbi:DUF2461 domain-containing protein [bacterium]|nr:MAG: DUF2461 domain-containing protein [bacterium]
MPTPLLFSSKTLSFLCSLKRHNDREWFKANRERYETDVRQPMITFVERMESDLLDFAPELIANPKKSIYRIYRDTRFSGDKTPYKTHIAAIFPHRDLPKHESGGLYLHVAHDHVFVGGGLYRPTPQQLYRLREHIASHVDELQEIVTHSNFQKQFGELQGERLKRVPRGFDPQHPAAAYLKHKQLLAGVQRPASFATSPRLYSSVLRLFKRLAPMIHFINQPLVVKNFRL